MLGAPSIKTGWNVFRPPTFCFTRLQELIAVNGIDRGIRHTLVDDSAAMALGITAPAAAPTVTMDSGGGASAGSYVCYYRYTDNDALGVPIPSSISPGTEISATASQKFKYSALSSTTETRVTHVEIWRTSVDQNIEAYKIIRLPYSGTVSAGANNAGTVRFTVPTGHGLVAGATFLMAGNSQAAYNTTHTVTAVGATTVDSSVAYVSNGSAATWTLNGYNEDTYTDEQLLALESENILNPAGGVYLSLSRFDPPPDNKAVVVHHLDRYWYAVDVEYTAGTVATNGTTTVTGTSTNWTAQMAGRWIYIAGEPAPLLISSASATSITLATAATTSGSGKAYAIRSTPADRNQIYYSEVDEPESVPAINAVVVPESPCDFDEITGLMPVGTALVVLKQRHLYRVTYSQQPQIYPQVSLIASRGCINQRCWTFYEDNAYLLDEWGLYRFNGESIDPLTGPIQDVFRDGATLDFSVRHWWSVEVDPLQEAVYCFVSYSGDTRPKHALVFHLRTGQWWTETYHREVGGITRIQVGGVHRLMSVGEQDVLSLHNESTLDGVTGSPTVRGTVTAGGSTTLTDSTAAFTSGVVGAPVTLLAADGTQQTRRISAATSTQLTVSAAWTTNPSAGDKYQVGAIRCQAKTSRMRVQRQRGGKEIDRDSDSKVQLTYQETTADFDLWLRAYSNNNATASQFKSTQKGGSNVEFKLNSTDAVIHMQRDTNVRGAQAGYASVDFPDRIDDRSWAGERYLSIELEVYQGAEAIRLYGLCITGIEGPPR